MADFDCPTKPQTETRAASPRGDSANATQETSAGETAGEVVGNKRSHIYHRPDCPGFGKVSEGNRVTFASGEEAEAAGYRLAGNCP